MATGHPGLPIHERPQKTMPTCGSLASSKALHSLVNAHFHGLGTDAVVNVHSRAWQMR